MRRKPLWARTLLWTGGIFVGLVAVCLIVLATLDWNTLRGPIGRYLSNRLHREVRLNGNLNVKLFSWTPTADVNGLVIAQPQWANAGSNSDFADVEHLRVSLDLKRLFSFHIVLPEVDVEHAHLRLLRDDSGRANWNFSDNPKAPPTRLPPIQHLIVKDGQLDVTDVKRKLTFNGMFSSEENDQRGGGQFFSLSGQGRLNREPFGLQVRGDPLLNIQPDNPYAFDAHVRAGPSRIDAKGSLSRPFDLGGFQAKASFVGPDLADLYYLTGLALPNTPPYNVSGDVVRDGDVWRVHNIAGKVGDSDIRGDLMVDASADRPYLKGDIASHKLNFDDLGPLIGAPPTKAAPATPTQKVAAARQVATGLALPDTPLKVERLRQMDADVHYHADTVASRDFPLRAADTKISLKDGVLKLTPVSFTFAHGTLNGDVRIDARKDVPVSDVDVRLSGLRLEQFVPATNPPSLEGLATARAKLHGVGNSVHKAASTASGDLTVVVPHGAIRQTFAELLGIDVSSALGLWLTNDQSQTEVRCAVADFSAKNGVLGLRQFVFDTAVVTASAEGTVNLSNERVDLAISGHPKKPQLVRLRTPITISGPLSHPAVGIKASSAIVQGGIAAGLALVLTPLAAILPFVDPGLGKDADCGALLAQAKAQGAPVVQARK